MSSLFSTICFSWFIFTLSLLSKVGDKTFSFPFPIFCFVSWFEQWINSVESSSLRQSKYKLFMLSSSSHAVMRSRLEFSPLNWIDSVPSSLIFHMIRLCWYLLTYSTWLNYYYFGRGRIDLYYCAYSEAYLNFSQWLFTEQWKESDL